MKLADWNKEEESDGEQIYNVIFDINDARNSLLCEMTMRDIKEMILYLQDIVDQNED